MKILEEALISKDWGSTTELIDYVIHNTDDFLTLEEMNELILMAKMQIESGYPIRWFLIES